MAIATRNEMASLLASMGDWKQALQLGLQSKEQLEKHDRPRENDVRF